MKGPGMAEKASQECLNCLNKALEITAQFIPLAKDCCDSGLEAQEFLSHLQAIRDRAAKMKSKLFPQER